LPLVYRNIPGGGLEAENGLRSNMPSATLHQARGLQPGINALETLDCGRASGIRCFLTRAMGNAGAGIGFFPRTEEKC
jgi:hypothetical protein